MVGVEIGQRDLVIAEPPAVARPGDVGEGIAGIARRGEHRRHGAGLGQHPALIDVTYVKVPPPSSPIEMNVWSELRCRHVRRRRVDSLIGQVR